MKHSFVCSFTPPRKKSAACAARGVLLMGVAPRIPGGGGKFKKTFENLNKAEKVLLCTNNNHTSEWGSGTAGTGTQH